MWEYLLNAIAYSAFGFFFGWVTGREAKNIETIRSVVAPEEKVEMDQSDYQRQRSEENRIDRSTITLSKRFGVLVLILSMLTVAQYTYSAKKATQCLANYNTSFAQAQGKLRGWNDDDRKALVAFLEASDPRLIPPINREERDKAYVELINQYAETTVKRANTPLPTQENCE